MNKNSTVIRSLYTTGTGATARPRMPTLLTLGGILERPDHPTEGLHVDLLLDIVRNLVGRAGWLRLPHHLKHGVQDRVLGVGHAVPHRRVEPFRPRHRHSLVAAARTGRAADSARPVPPRFFPELVVGHAEHKRRIDKAKLPTSPALPLVLGAPTQPRAQSKVNTESPPKAAPKTGAAGMA